MNPTTSSPGRCKAKFPVWGGPFGSSTKQPDFPPTEERILVMAVYQFTVTLPLQDNTGNDLSQETEQVKSEILDLVGGYSQTVVAGAWKADDGTVYNDMSLEIATYCQLDQAQHLASKAPGWCKLLRQLALLVTYTPVESVQFVEPAK